MRNEKQGGGGCANRETIAIKEYYHEDLTDRRIEMEAREWVTQIDERRDVGPYLPFELIQTERPSCLKASLLMHSPGRVCTGMALGDRGIMDRARSRASHFWTSLFFFCPL